MKAALFWIAVSCFVAGLFLTILGLSLHGAWLTAAGAQQLFNVVVAALVLTLTAERSRS